MTQLSTDGHIEALFELYKRKNVGLAFPRAGQLSDLLNREADRVRARSHSTWAADREIARLFVSAAIEIWHRSIHSFLISAALTKSSAVWASVAGYYSSHYVVRAYAHLLGRYMLYRQRKVVALTMQNGQFYCELQAKHGGDREHRAYWRFVKESSTFGKDPFVHVDVDAAPVSDSAHRNKANYLDHIGNYGAFDALTKEAIVTRIERLADIEITALPLPNADHFPDLDRVQLIAYHRLVGFRKYLDNLLGDSNRFWSAHRAPSWASPFLDFQVTEPQINLAQARP